MTYNFYLFHLANLPCHEEVPIYIDRPWKLKTEYHSALWYFAHCNHGNPLLSLCKYVYGSNFPSRLQAPLKHLAYIAFSPAMLGEISWTDLGLKSQLFHRLARHRWTNYFNIYKCSCHMLGA